MTSLYYKSCVLATVYAEYRKICTEEKLVCFLILRMIPIVFFP